MTIYIDWVEARDSKVFFIVQPGKLMEKKGELAEGISSPKLISGTVQKMHRTVAYCGELSAHIYRKH